MAITASQLQAQLGTNAMSPQVLRELPPHGGTTQQWLISGGATYPGVTKMMTTTASDNAATQATTMATKAKKGAGGHD